nr:gamma-glutamyl-gamma-aminobutyrate hydrolase family protein [Hyphomicrobium sp.]
MKSAVALRHIPIEGLGVFEDVLRQQGYDVRYVDVWKDDITASLATEPDLLVVLGGPMGVYEADRYPFLNDEIRVIQGRLASGKPMLGICLGAQLIAHAAGGRVYPGAKKEIGYFPMSLTADGEASCLSGLAAADFNVLHWHGDTF